MINNSFLLVFALAFMGCVLSTPLVTRLAIWAGAVDQPDQFRRIHKGATPRMGGLGLAFGLAISILLVSAGGYLEDWSGFHEWWASQWAVVVASSIVLVVGVVDDTIGMRPRLKLLGQTSAVLVLFLGGIQIARIAILGLTIELGEPSLTLNLLGRSIEVALPSLLVTMFWFLGCMNIWNLIDGMDGLASGVGLLVSGTLMLIAIHQQNMGAAILAAALAGGLAGFLLYNWHPACIFLGDTGSLLIGLLVGVIGAQYQLKKTSAVSLLFPILAMGLPISDTAMAIFRRWVRNLPLSAADRHHIHHVMIRLGLSPRLAALYLYLLSAFLCGVVLMGVVYDREFLALVIGLSGCLAFLMILPTERRTELAGLRADLVSRFSRKRQERFAAKVTWEAIQRIELCEDVDRIWVVLLGATEALGCDTLRMSCYREGRAVFKNASDLGEDMPSNSKVTGPTATFRLSSGQDLMLAVELHQSSESTMAADIAFRFLQRLSLATAERLERLLASESEPIPPRKPVPIEQETVASVGTDEGKVSAALTTEAPTGRPPVGDPNSGEWDPLSWLRLAFGWQASRVDRTHSLGEE